MARPRGLAPMLCSATSKRTGKPCRRFARVGAVVCPSHGSEAPQTERKAEQRLTLAQIMSAGQRDPRRALLDAVGCADALFLEGKQRIVAGDTLTPEEMDRFISSLGRVAALAKISVDARLIDSMTSDWAPTVARAAGIIQQTIGALVDRLEADPDRRTELRAWCVEDVTRQLREIEHGTATTPVPTPPPVRPSPPPNASQRVPAHPAEPVSPLECSDVQAVAVVPEPAPAEPARPSRRGRTRKPTAPVTVEPEPVDPRAENDQAWSALIAERRADEAWRSRW
jgi:hypothetical protein